MISSQNNEDIKSLTESINTLQYRLDNKNSIIFPIWRINRALEQVASDLSKIKSTDKHSSLPTLLDRVQNLTIKAQNETPASQKLGVISMLWNKYFASSTAIVTPTDEANKTKIQINLSNLTTKVTELKASIQDPNEQGPAIDTGIKLFAKNEKESSLIQEAVTLLITPEMKSKDISSILGTLIGLNTDNILSICRLAAHFKNNENLSKEMPTILNLIRQLPSTPSYESDTNKTTCKTASILVKEGMSKQLIQNIFLAARFPFDEINESSYLKAASFIKEDMNSSTIKNIILIINTLPKDFYNSSYKLLNIINAILQSIEQIPEQERALKKTVLSEVIKDITIDTTPTAISNIVADKLIIEMNAKGIKFT